MPEINPLRDNHSRISAVDALRGFALLGICIVNLPLIARSWQSLMQAPATAGGRLGLLLNSLLCEAKFFTLFSFLFGIGIYYLHRRESTAFLVRRFFALIVLGFLHAVLLFPGDILLSYGIIGLLFLPLRNLHHRALLVAAVCCLVLGIFTYWLLGVLSLSAPTVPETHYLDTYSAAVRSNLTVYPVSLGYVLLFNWPGALAMVCVGYLAAREHWLTRLRLNLFSTLLIAAGLAGSLLYANAATYQLKQLMPLAMVLLAASAPLFSIFYAQLIFSLAMARPGSPLIAALSAAGRMSLTNYLLQSLIAGVLFHGYGFGLYDRLDHGGLILVSAAIFVVEILFSVLWLRYFQTGPVEWLLRSFSHLRRMPV